MNIIWGQCAKFGNSDSNTYMIYYGFLILGVFIGVGIGVSEPPNKKKPRSDHMIHKEWCYNRESYNG